MNMRAERLNLAYGALADPTRRAILARLRKGDATVMELAKPFELTQPTITKHLQVLERAGLISRGRDAQRRPCRIEPAALQMAAAWLLDFRHFWESSFDRLDGVLAEQSASKRPTRNDGENR
jgi:DNA-binding transcriptional ArsR family regulator